MPTRIVLAVLAVLSIVAACHAVEPTNKPIDTCVRACNAKASRQCSEAQCERGCEFILDRLIEREGDTVVRCVATSPRRCTDVVWADCAAHVGPHLDGGPPGPPPPAEED